MVVLNGGLAHCFLPLLDLSAFLQFSGLKAVTAAESRGLGIGCKVIFMRISLFVILIRDAIDCE